MRERVEGVLYRLGITGRYQGYYYLIIAVLMAVEKEENLMYISKFIYPRIAEQYHTSITCIERNLRTVGKNMIIYGDRELLTRIYGNCDRRPRNADLIAKLARYIKADMHS